MAASPTPPLAASASPATNAPQKVLYPFTLNIPIALIALSQILSQFLQQAPLTERPGFLPCTPMT